MKTLFSCVSILIVFIGCDISKNENNSFDYSIEQQRNCFCPQAGVWVKLFINADTVTDAIRLSDNDHLTYAQRKPYKSIKELFDLIARFDSTTYNLTIKIDSVNNYPSYIYFNPNPLFNGDTAVFISDAQWSYTTRNYVRLN